MYKGKVAVRKIVEFILRRGDIDSRKVSNHTAQEGARIHRQLQKEAGDAYQKEVFFKRESQIEKDSIIHFNTCIIPNVDKKSTNSRQLVR